MSRSRILSASIDPYIFLIDDRILDGSDEPHWSSRQRSVYIDKFLASHGVKVHWQYGYRSPLRRVGRCDFPVLTMLRLYFDEAQFNDMTFREFVEKVHGPSVLKEPSNNGGV